MMHLQNAIEGRFLLPIGFKLNPNFSTKGVTGGYLLEMVNEGTVYETILSLTTGGGTKYALNSQVVANRLMFDINMGDEGTIIGILHPHSNGYSDDVIIVRFENGKIAKLKTKEIDIIL
ncbi:MAG: hypothetical protein WCG45_01455 [bacterium]